MILSTVDLPAPLRPRRPILAPGKNESEMSLRICRLGGTTLPTRFIVNTYCAMAVPSGEKGAELEKPSILTDRRGSALSDRGRPIRAGRSVVVPVLRGEASLVREPGRQPEIPR